MSLLKKGVSRPGDTFEEFLNKISEFKSGSELHDARIGGCRDLPESRAVDAFVLPACAELRGCTEAPIDVVKEVEGFGAKLHAHSFVKADVFEQSGVNVEISRTVDDRATEISDFSRRSLRENRSVEADRRAGDGIYHTGVDVINFSVSLIFFS